MKKPCCCPLPQVGAPQTTTCNATPSQCKCHVVPALSSRYGYTHHNHQPVYSPSYYPPTYSNNWHGNNYYYRRHDPFAPLFVPLFFIICCCACCFGNRFRHNHTYATAQEGVPIATAAVGQDDGVPIATAVNAPSENPAYKSWYGSTSNSSNHHNHHHGGGGGSNVASGLGGFAIGTIVGDLIGRSSGGGGHHHHQNNNVPFGVGFFGDGNGRGYFGGGTDGGYDIAGDSGDNNNFGGGGYDIQGDSGGYDIQGDS